MHHPHRSARASTAASWLLCLALPFGPGCGHGDHDHGAHGGGGHSHAALRGGVMVELGNHQGYLEFLLDPAAGHVSLWSYDAHAENPVRLGHEQLVLDLQVVHGPAGARDVAESLVLLPVASAMTGERAGDTSEFGGKHPLLEGVSGFSGRLREVLHRGTQYRDLAIEVHTATGQ